MADRSVIVASKNTTIVKQITVGRPIRRVVQATPNINGLQGIDTTQKTNGSILVYDSSTDKWTATLNLQDQNINGGSY